MLDAGSLWGLIERRVAATPDAVMLLDEDGRTLTFAEYRDTVERVAAALYARGVGEGTDVSWLLPTWNETAVLIGALSRLSARQNPMLPIYRHREVSFIVGQTGATLLITPSVWKGFDYGAMAEQVAAERGGLELLVCDRSLPEADPSSCRRPRSGHSGDAVRWIYYTSGTTSDPKGVRHSDGTLLAGGTASRRAGDVAGPTSRRSRSRSPTSAGRTTSSRC